MTPSALSLKIVRLPSCWRALTEAGRRWDARSAGLPTACHGPRFSDQPPGLAGFNFQAKNTAVVANLQLTFYPYSVAQPRSNEPSGLVLMLGFYLARAPSPEVPPACRTKAPVRTTGGGGWCPRCGKPRKRCLCAHRCLFVLAFVVGRVGWGSPCR